MRRIIEFFKTDQNEKLIKNMEAYAEKEKTKQQKSKVYGQKPIKRKTNSKEKAISYALYEFLHLEDNKSRKDLFETLEDSDKLFK